MKATSIKLSPQTDRKLTELARLRKTTRSAIVRDALDALETRPAQSVAAAAADLAGSLRGPVDLSTNREHMAAYGK